MYLYGGLDKPVALGVLLLFSLYLGMYHALFAFGFGIIFARAGSRATLIATPFLWVAVELTRTLITGFPWDLLGYTQVDNLWLTELAPWGGVMILSFVVVAVGAVIAGGLMSTDKKMELAVGGGGVLLAVVLSLGHLRTVPADVATRHATLLQENLAVGSEKNKEVLSTQDKYASFERWSQNPLVPAAQGDSLRWVAAPPDTRNDFIIWPEAPADFATSDPIYQSQLSALARSSATTTVSGSVGVDLDPTAEDGYHEFGSAAVWDASGNYLGRYDKIHRVPWGEYVPYKRFFFFAEKLVAGVGRMEPGTERKLFPLGQHKFGIFICYESIFGNEVRQFVKNGANVLINISDDGWYGDSGAPWQHLDMERMRAIETRRWILRDTNTGVTTAIDPHGRGVFSTPRHTREAFQFAFDYRSDLTFYTRHGDWFAWLCAAVAMGVLGYSFTRKLEVH